MDSSLIQLVNRLQDTFHNLGGELDMPQIVVVGSQSAGKSSVLETIVGRDFLPRGSGIVTRRPLILQLNHIDSDDEWAHFLHVDKKFVDFEDVRKEVEAETFRVAGQNKGISKLPISLKIFSKHVLDLTLVDLPGLTKIPVGDQPSDIERQIRNLVFDYIEQPNSIILAVSAANVDLANSEALKLAKQVDPQMRRTLGVLTKLDLMDAGTNALDILTGRVYPLKLGFIGVVNRSQADINENKPLSYSLDKESQFFASHPVYRNISHKQGTRYLSRVLNSVLMAHIREKLPDMKARLNTLMGQTQQELNSLGESPGNGDKNLQGALILRLMTQFARDFISSIDGTAVSISTKELSGGARIYYIFNDVFGSALSSISPLQNLADSDIRTAIRNSTGPRPSLFVPEIAFDLLVKPQIQLLETPALRCVELVYEELVKICHACNANEELSRFPKLHAQLVEVVSELLRERLGPTSEYASSLIKIQSAYINTNHPMFTLGSADFDAAGRRGGGTATPAFDSAHTRLPEDDTDESIASHDHLSHDGDGEQHDLLNEDDELGDNREKSVKHKKKKKNSQEDRTAKYPQHIPHRHHDPQQPPPPQPNGTTTNNGRSVSATLPDRKPVSTKMGGTNRLSDVSSLQRRQENSGSARETFLNYLFGGNPPPPTAPPTNATTTTIKTGREMNDTDGGGMNTGLLAGKQGVGNSGMKSLSRHIEAVPQSDASREEVETNLIRGLISTYFNLVRQSVADLIPKAIMHFLVNHTCGIVQDRLVGSLYKPEIFGELLDEDEELVAERTRVKALLEAYKEAFKTLSEVGMKAV